MSNTRYYTCIISRCVKPPGIDIGRIECVECIECIEWQVECAMFKKLELSGTEQSQQPRPVSISALDCFHSSLLLAIPLFPQLLCATRRRLEFKYALIFHIHTQAIVTS